MGAENALDAGPARGVTPWALWIGLFAGPAAWALDLTVSYALVPRACDTHSPGTLQLLSIASLTIAAGAAATSWWALGRTSNHGPTDGGRPGQRARFMAVLGLASSALFALQIIAGAVPHWVLDACQ